MINFTDCKINKYKMYGGQNGNKICIKYNEEDYMLKFPSNKKALNDKSSTNSCISEYLSCKIISSLGLNAQKTLLGTYDIDNKEKIVVTCLDFTKPNYTFKEFAHLKNSSIESSNSGYGTELSEVLVTIEEELIYDNIELKKFFWNMFIADTLVGNFDRHNGNWGFLVDEENEKVEIAPIYDCGSCLYIYSNTTALTDEDISRIINDEEELESRVYVFPNSALKINGNKINYYNFISSMENKDCNQALLNIFPKINLNKINEIIDNTLYISNLRKEFYKKIIKMRYNLILKHTYDLLTQVN